LSLLSCCRDPPSPHSFPTRRSSDLTAAFIFRDEIKQAIGVNFVGIIYDATNATIGGFVGAYEAIKVVWAGFPSALGDLVFQGARSEEHTSELQSRENLVCRLLLEKK